MIFYISESEKTLLKYFYKLFLCSSVGIFRFYNDSVETHMAPYRIRKTPVRSLRRIAT